MGHYLLSQPVPDLGPLRRLKVDYRDYPVHSTHQLYDEELVLIHEYGLAGQAYYSRPNAATGDSVKDVPKELYVRKSVAKKLQRINHSLDAPEVIDLFGGAVELYIEDAYRSYKLQQYLYAEVFPKLIRSQNPGISNSALEKKLKGLIAKPTKSIHSPAPHATGGAIDVALRYKQDTLYFVKDAKVFFGSGEADTSETVFPDYYEHALGQAKDIRKAQANRRAFYAIMTGLAFGKPTDFQVNPTEWWHWSYGDQMWAKLSGKSAATYGYAELVE